MPRAGHIRCVFKKACTEICSLQVNRSHWLFPWIKKHVQVMQYDCLVARFQQYAETVRLTTRRKLSDSYILFLKSVFGPRAPACYSKIYLELNSRLSKTRRREIHFHSNRSLCELTRVLEYSFIYSVYLAGAPQEPSRQ
jgi:hypothetical protein